MITVVDGHTVTQTVHELTDTEVATITKVLAALGVRVELTEPDFYGAVHVWALEPCDTTWEVRALRATSAVTDSPLIWHGVMDRG